MDDDKRDREPLTPPHPVTFYERRNYPRLTRRMEMYMVTGALAVWLTLALGWLAWELLDVHAVARWAGATLRKASHFWWTIF